MAKHYQLAVVSLCSALASLLFLKLGLHSYWWLLPAAIFWPIAYGTFVVLSNKKWLHVAVAIVSAILLLVVWGAAWQYLLVAALLAVMQVWGYFNVKKDVAILVKINIADLARRPVKMLMLVLALLFAIGMGQIVMEKVRNNEVIIPVSYQFELLRLTTPDFNEDTSLDQALHNLSSNRDDSIWTKEMTDTLIHQLGVIRSKQCIASPKIINCPNVIDALVGQRLNYWLLSLGQLAPLAVTLIVWEILLAIIYLVLPIVLIISLLIYKILYKLDYFTFRRANISKYEIVLRY